MSTPVAWKGNNQQEQVKNFWQDLNSETGCQQIANEEILQGVKVAIEAARGQQLRRILMLAARSLTSEETEIELVTHITEKEDAHLDWIGLACAGKHLSTEAIQVFVDKAVDGERRQLANSFLNWGATNHELTDSQKGQLRSVL